MGLVIIALMFAAYGFSQNPAVLALMPAQFVFAAPIFAFGLVAFAFWPWHGDHRRGQLRPVTDNASPFMN